MVKELVRTKSPLKRQYNVVAEYLNRFNFHEEALRIYENMELRFILTAEEYNNISDVNLSLKRLDIAEEYIKRALAKKRAPLFLVTYSEILLEKGNNDLAEQSILEVLKSEEGNEYVNVLLATVYINQGRKDDAIHIINQFANVDSVYSPKWSSLRSKLD